MTDNAQIFNKGFHKLTTKPLVSAWTIPQRELSTFVGSFSLRIARAEPGVDCRRSVYLKNGDSSEQKGLDCCTLSSIIKGDKAIFGARLAKKMPPQRYGFVASFRQIPYETAATQY